MARACSECGAPLSGRATSAKTCSKACRSKRSRRLKRVRQDNGHASAYNEGTAALAEVNREETKDIARELIVDELRPIVRETITEDVINAIGRLVALTPDALAALEEDLKSNDTTIRQRAYTQLLKYTVGHAAIVRPPEEEDSKNLVVNFNLPRPGDAATSEVTDATEIKQCDSCHQDKPVSEFVANSDRCQACFDSAASAAAKILDAN